MALWGKADGVFSPGTITVDYDTKTIIGSGTSFGAVGVTTGAVITIGVGGTYGNAVISGIASETQISIATTQYLSGQSIAGVAYSISQKPVYTLEDANYYTLGVGNTINAIYGVDEFEVAANNATGSKYSVAHAGWVGIKTYVDAQGQLRVKSEVLVAMSGISTDGLGTYTATGDADDDQVFPDRFITILTQPISLVGVSTTESQIFTVSASATPSAALSYQWQFATSVGAAYTDVTDGLVYSDSTTDTLGIAATTTSEDRPDGYLFRVVVTADGGASATSDSATITYA